ncbi:MAG: TlpA family protein disulfide reductase [Bacteroides sp.]|nr:TlpA family protein disulfide reductase [Bacteroides sp.]
MRHHKAILFILLASFILQFVIMPARAYSFMLSSVIGFFAYYLFTFWELRKYAKTVHPIVIVLACIIGAALIEIPFRLYSPKTTLTSLPDFLLRLLGILFAACGYNRKKSIQIFIFTFALVLNLFMSTALFYPMSGWQMWVHKRNTGNFTPQLSVPHKISSEVWKRIPNKDNSYTLKDSMNGKVALIDFWIKQCNYCWKSFPYIEQIYQRYQSNNEVCICSIFTEITPEENGEYAEKLLRDKGYTFPVYSISKKNNVLDTLNIRTYPRLLLLDQQGNLILNTTRSNATFIISEIERLLEE